MVTLIRRRPRRRAMESETNTTAPVTNTLDSFFDVLNRDQRTIVTVNRNWGRNEKVESWYSFRDFPRSGSKVSRRGDQPEVYKCSDNTIESFIKKVKTRSWGSQRRFNSLMSRLGEVFIVGVCLLTIVRVPVVLSAPSARHTKTTELIHNHRALHIHNPTENILGYLYPCGKGREEEFSNTYYPMASKEKEDPDIYKRIIISSKNTLSYTERFRDLYVEKTFHVPFKQHHEQSISQKYDWLPNEGNGIPKKLGQPVDVSQFKNKNKDEFLQLTYENLQKFAIGLEQIVIDQKKAKAEFTENFRKTESLLKALLCEVRDAMTERNLIAKEIPRNIMSDELRHFKNASSKNSRDWYIFRDFMIYLEYTIDGFTYYDENKTDGAGASTS